MNVILGGGLSGLAAGVRLTRAGSPVTVIEKDTRVGGLAKTVTHGRFRFDLGGHRFLTDNSSLKKLVVELLGADLLTVSRKSQIYMPGKYFDYPLSPANAIFGLGVGVTAGILLDYCKEKMKSSFGSPPMVSLEDWVVAQFGRRMFDLYFKEYSEKVWGIDCSRISMEWVATRIDGLSLWQTIKHAFFKFSGRGIKTFTDSFLYPRLGIGQLADNLAAAIAKENDLLCGTGVERVVCSGGRVESVFLKNARDEFQIRGRQYISSIPLTILLDKMDPAPPDYVLAAASRISFRSLAIATLMLDRERVTDLTWMYLPGKEIPFGRIHEPKNWSSEMAPAGQTHVVAEYFCNTDDQIWSSTDEELVHLTAQQLQKLGFFKEEEVVDSCVLKIPYAYPVFSVGYQEHLKVITDYLARFTNLHLIGRSGRYSYLNMDYAMESGILAAEQILAGRRNLAGAEEENFAGNPNPVPLVNYAEPIRVKA